MKKILSFLISLSTFIIHAQAKKYTLEECVMIALEKNISIQQSELDLEGADIDRADAFGNFFPRINAQSQHIWNNGLSQNITNGLIFSQRVLLELTNYGFSREKAYKIVQRNAQNSWKKNINFYESLINDKDVKKNISNKELKKMFDVSFYTKKVNNIFKRIFK